MTDDQIEKRIVMLRNSVLEFLRQACLEHNYSAAELYVVTKLLFNGTRKVIGPDAIKYIDEHFSIIDFNDYNGIC